VTLMNNSTSSQRYKSKGFRKTSN